MKENRGRIVVFAVFAVIVVWWIKADSTQDKRRKERITSQEKLREANAEENRALGRQYDADFNWSDHLKNRYPIYTLQMQEALHVGTGRRIIFTGMVEDLVKTNLGYELRVLSIQAPIGGFRAFLDCEESTARDLVKAEAFQEVTIVATISSVEKAAFSIRAAAHNDDAPTVEIGGGDEFLARGVAFAIKANRE